MHDPNDHVFFSSPFWLKYIGWVGSFWGSAETTCPHPLCLWGPQFPIGILWDGYLEPVPAISVIRSGVLTQATQKNAMNRISRDGSIVNSLIHRWWIIKIWSWSTESAPIHRPSILLEGKFLPSNNETWLTGKSPINKGFNGKIIYKISTVQYTTHRDFP